MNVKMSTRLVSKTLVKVKGRVEFTCLGKLDDYRKLNILYHCWTL